MSEESKLVDEVKESTETTETTENNDKFNPLAFAGDDIYNETEEKEEKEEAVTESEKSEDPEGDVTKDDEEGFSWEKKTASKEETEDEEFDWEGNTESKKEKESEPKVTDVNWSTVSKELGINATSKEELIATIEAYVDQQRQPDPQTAQTQQLKSFLSLNDRKLVTEELKADGLDASEIEESLDKLEDSGMLKMKAKSIRRIINNAIDAEAQQERQRMEAQKKNITESASKARKELQNHIKGMEDFMGGKVTKKQKEEVYRYATGKMMKDIYDDHANVADVAMFMLYKEQITKILRSQGLADGKAAIMDSIVSPNLNNGKGKSNFKVKTGKFDPKAFMSE
jgi:hypothetical protein